MAAKKPSPKAKASTASAPTPDPPSRRVPLQARSRERVARMLDAAAEVFVERGFDAATVEEIAERAGTSIGSVYQFFPNKVALFDAIAAKYLDESRAMFEQVVTPEALALPWDELLDRVIDGFAALHRTSAHFRAVWLNLQLSREFVAAGQALNREYASRAELVLAANAPRLAPEDRPRVAMMVVEVISAMLLVSVRLDPERADALLSETKVLVRRYVAPFVAP